MSEKGIPGASSASDDRRSARSNDLTGDLHFAAAAEVERAAERRSELRNAPVLDVVANAALRAVDHLVDESPDLEGGALVERVNDSVERTA